jgi:two-component system sensor histidine kinase ChvG
MKKQDNAITEGKATQQRDLSATAAGKARRLIFSPLTWRILAINILALAIPIVGLLYVGPYRDGLIETELEALRTQTDIFAGALGEGAIQTEPSGRQVLNITHARDMIRRLTAAASVRARLYLNSGGIIADSRHLGNRGRRVRILSLPPPPDDITALRQFAATIDWLFDQMHARTDLDTYREAQNQSISDYPETRLALAGEVTGVARRDGSGGYVLSVAMPVQRYREVIGVIMLSQSGADIQEAVRNVRFVVLQVFAGALVITVLLSLYLAGTIARPVHQLAEAAIRVRRGIGGDAVEIPDMTKRRDEIGDLSGSLRDMTTALYQRIDAIGRFAADVSHEIKNPLTSLRSAVETAARIDDPVQQQRLMTIILDDVQRLDRLISDISDYSRLDAELGREIRETVDLGDMLRMLVDIHQTAGENAEPPRRIEINAAPDADLRVPALESRLAQVFRNIIGNAASFNPPGGLTRIELVRDDGFVTISLSDDGPGIPEGKLGAIFDRFYSERPTGEKFGTHSGLGLSISKQIVEAHGGTIRAENRADESGNTVGAKFIIQLPAQ